MKHHRAPAPDRPSYAPILPDALYPLPAIKANLHWGDESIAKAQRDGLRTVAYGRWKYVSGRELIRFIEAQADRQAGATGEGGPLR